MLNRTRNRFDNHKPKCVGLSDWRARVGVNAKTLSKSSKALAFSSFFRKNYFDRFTCVWAKCVGASIDLEFFGSFFFKEKTNIIILITENRVFEKELTLVQRNVFWKKAVLQTDEGICKYGFERWQERTDRPTRNDLSNRVCWTEG
ncbi:MAG: hypothetical protein ACJASQ_002735 [Crocinitomicaceae bacterium]|jgi:hypothetical protein